MSYTDVSIDLETLGVKPGSVITQIGLCAFNRRPASGGTSGMSSTLIHVDPQSCIDAGFFVDWSTVSWWLQQEEAPRVKMAKQKGDHIATALTKVISWFAENADIARRSNVWGHGCGFDCTQLEIAFQKMLQPVPWDFRHVRDLRTLIDLEPAANVDRPVPTEAHNAMEDAVAQARWIQSLTWQIEKRHVNVINEAPHGVPRYGASGGSDCL